MLLSRHALMMVACVLPLPDFYTLTACCTTTYALGTNQHLRLWIQSAGCTWNAVQQPGMTVFEVQRYVSILWHMGMHLVMRRHSHWTPSPFRTPPPPCLNVPLSTFLESFYGDHNPNVWNLPGRTAPKFADFVYGWSASKSDGTLYDMVHAWLFID